MGTGRAGLTLIGAMAGLCLYALALVLSLDLLVGRVALAAAVLAATFFAAVLGMTGPLPMARAARSAAALAVAMALLVTLASLRFDPPGDVFAHPTLLIPALVAAFVPMPFLIAAGRGDWRSYATLFAESWSLVVRTGAAWLFAGLIWVVILLSDALLGLVGIGLVMDLASLPPVAATITGAGFGLALGVLNDRAEPLSPGLVLRLLRLLLPVVLAASVLFLLALPVAGLEVLSGRVSAAITLLVMVTLGATLVTTAIDRSDDEAVRQPVMRGATALLALILPVPAVLALWAVWLRVSEHGLTPGRIFALLVAGFGLAYGLTYALSVLRGAGWMGRIRRANAVLALAVAAVSALWLTPLVNSEALSARSLVDRVTDGRTPASELDLAVLEDWGRAGTAARAELEDLARDPARTDLARVLAGQPAPPADAVEEAALRQSLAAAMPLQPPTATATRDLLLAGLGADEVLQWLDACRQPLPTGGPGCVMVVADLWPRIPGEEAIALLRDPSGWTRIDGLALRDGILYRPPVTAAGGILPDLAAGEAMIAAFQAAPPPVMPSALNQLGAGEAGLILLP